MYKEGDKFLYNGPFGTDEVVSFIKKTHLGHIFKFENGGDELFLNTENIKPLKTEAEKRGAKFGVNGIVKATGDRVVFQKEDTSLYGDIVWYFLRENAVLVDFSSPSEIRLDHEPEYKEIPFSEATDEQRLKAEYITGTNGEDVEEIYCFSNGSFGYTIKGSNRVFHETSTLYVRVPT